MKVLWWLQNDTFMSRVLKLYSRSVHQINVWLVTCIPLSCGSDGVHYLYDAMQSRVCPNGHVGATEVVVNRAHHANDVEMGGTLGLICCDLTWAQIEMTTIGAGFISNFPCFPKLMQTQNFLSATANQCSKRNSEQQSMTCCTDGIRVVEILNLLCELL